jgi:coenzyme F420-reducing hydrogenase beta subunit
MVKIGLFCRSSETYENSIWYLAFEETATDLYTVFNQEFDCHKGHMVEYLDGEAALRHSSAPKEGGTKS